MIRAILLALILVAITLTVFIALGNSPKIYLITAFYPPLGAPPEIINQTLAEIRNYAMWASWYDEVGIYYKDKCQVIKEAVDTYGIKTTIVRGFRPTAEIEVRKKGNEYVANINGTIITAPTLEELAWRVFEKTNGSLVDTFLDDVIVCTVYNLPLLAGAFVIPFGNNTYYGPDRLGVAISDILARYIFPQNRTVKLIKAPRVVWLDVKPLGPSWYGYYVVDATLVQGLVEISPKGIVAIVDRSNLDRVLKALEGRGFLTNVQPIG